MTQHSCLSASIISGKGGVGKTNIALNLAYALHKAGQKVLLMDCDLGLANLDVLLGIAPKVALEQVIHGQAELREAVIPLESAKLSLLPASSGMHVLVDAASPLHFKFLHNLNEFAAQFDYLLLDVGAGISDSVQHFASKTAMKILVITPEPTSITDAYALIKVLSAKHNIKDFHVVVNMAESPEEEKEPFERLCAACERFLGFSLKLLGSIRSDDTMQQAVRRQAPLLKFAPTSPSGKDLVAAAAKLHKQKEKMPLPLQGPLRLTE